MQPPIEKAPITLTNLAESANEKLEAAVIEATHRAFNLGCFVGLAPAAIFASITFIVVGFSVISAAIAIVLAFIGLIAFANLAAMITRRNTMRQKYFREILPEIELTLHRHGYTSEEFEAAARQILPPTAMLAAFLPQHPDNPPPDGEPL
jgi:hypothetical protein